MIDVIINNSICFYVYSYVKTSTKSINECAKFFLGEFNLIN